MKRRWLFIPLLLALVTFGITAGATMAYGGGDGDSPVKSFASRVAGILGLEESKVQDAFNQAADEARVDRLTSKLDRLVTEGSITQEQADQYLSWFQARPDGVLPGSRFHGFGRHGHFGSRMFGGHGLFGGSMFGGDSTSGMRFFGPAPDAKALGTDESITY